MFRQQKQINCNCSLFPQPPIPKVTPFRSPQRCNPHKQNKSKKSLKCHSSSRYKGLQKINSNKQEKLNKIISSKMHCQQPQTLQSTRSQIFRMATDPLNRNSQNYQGNYISINDNLKQRHKNAFDMKVSNQSILQNYASTRATSPLNPYDLNTQRKVTFNYKTEDNYQPSTKMYAISPNLQKVNYKTNQNTTTTTLVGSCMPNSDIRKKHLQQRSMWSKESFNQFALPDQNQILHYQTYTAVQSPQVQKVDYISRPRTSSNIFIMSRLTQMMNQKEETESIYEGQKTHEEGGVEYSRVLISCKKLMEDNKNGVLQQSAQTKLFDYDEKIKEAFVKNSNMFGQIKIQRR